MKLSLKNLSKTKKILLFLVGPLVVLIVAAVVYLVLSTSHYSDHNNQLYTGAKQDIDSQIYADQLSVQSLVDINSTASEASHKLCQTSFITEKILSSGDLADCQAHRAKLTDVAAKSSIVASYLQTEQAVASVFDQASTQLTDVKPGDYTGQKKVWHQARQSMSSLTASDAYADQLAAHLASIDSIIKGYDGVTRADKSQQRDKFDDSVADLQAAYDNLGDTKDDTKSTYHESTNQLLDAIELL